VDEQQNQRGGELPQNEYIPEAQTTEEQEEVMYKMGGPNRTPSVPPVPSSLPKPIPLYVMNGGESTKRRRFWSIAWSVFKFLVIILLIGALFSRFTSLDGIEEGLYSGTNQAEKIALIDIEGVITMEMPALVRAKLQRAQRDDSVKGIILVVNSPGGGVVPSDMIHRYLTDCSKPVYASIEQLGASGAYWISSACEKIYAQKNAVVGSIGVIYTSFVLQDALENKLGIDPVVLIARKAVAKDRGSIFRVMTEEEKTEVLNDLDTVHERFVEVVSEGRALDKETVWTLATGDVYDGPESLANGLADAVGFLEDAITDMTEAQGLTDPQILRYTRIPTIEDFLKAGAMRLGMKGFGLDRQLEELRQWTGVQALWQGY